MTPSSPSFFLPLLALHPLSDSKQDCFPFLPFLPSFHNPCVVGGAPPPVGIRVLKFSFLNLLLCESHGLCIFSRGRLSYKRFPFLCQLGRCPFLRMTEKCTFSFLFFCALFSFQSGNWGEDNRVCDWSLLFTIHAYFPFRSVINLRNRGLSVAYPDI